MLIILGWCTLTPLFQDFRLLGWAVEQSWTDGTIRKPDSVSGLNPGQTDTETRVLRCNHCSQKPYPVNTLVNACSSDQLGESTC